MSKTGSLGNIPSKVKQSQRTKKGLAPEETLPGDISPYNTLTSADQQRIKAVKKESRIGTIFPFNTKSKLDQLNEILEGYSESGLPAMPELLTLGRAQYDEEIFQLESRWTEIVQNPQNLSKRERHHQERVWEIVHTEVETIHKLQVIKDLFQCCLINLQQEALLNEIEVDRVFSNICDVYYANCQLWDEYMLPMVQQSRDTGQPLDPTLMKDGFFQFEEIFRPYTKFCLEQENCLEYLKKKSAENELFRSFIVWAEGQKICNRLKITDLLVTPMHRLTRYKLLLVAILDYTENDDQRKQLMQMIARVEQFVHQVNTALRQRQEQVRLAEIIKRIDSYDVLEGNKEEYSKLVEEYTKLDLTCPIPGCGPQHRRHLLREGSLKLKDGTTKTEVYCFLFTDMFLVTKFKDKRSDKVKVIKPPMRLDKLVAYANRDGVTFLLVYLNEYNLASSMYTLTGDAKLWVSEIHKSQEKYKKMRQVQRDQSENQLLYLSQPLYDGEDDEYSAELRADYSPDSAVYYRMDSHGSAENYIPNLSISRSSSQDTLVRVIPEGAGDRHSPLVASVSLDETDPTLRRPDRRRGQTVHDMRSRSPHGHPSLQIRKSASDYEEADRTFLVPRAPASGRVTPEMNEQFQKLVLNEVAYSAPPHISRVPAFQRTDSNSSDSSLGQGPSGGPKRLPMRPDLPIDEMLARKRNTKRNSRNEKRYFTADAIQDIKNKDKDTSIYKRLSLNITPVDINIDEKRTDLRHKTISSDSLQSMPSSSGVSSTGSLHLSPESLCEENESESSSVSTIRYSSHYPSDYSEHHGVVSFAEEPSETPPLPEEPPPSPSSTHPLAPSQLPHSPSDPSSPTPSSSSGLSSQTQNKSFSKSMPDITTMMSPGEARDGITSVRLDTPTAHPQRRKMTDAEILRMKKLLLNSTLEASEV